MKTQTVYKVVTLHDSPWIEPYFSSVSDNCFSLKYEIGKTTRPKVGKIFVFAKLADAISFRDCVAGNAIFEGIGKNPTRARLCCNSSYFIANFWKLKKQKASTHTAGSCTVCSGTVFVDSFKPKELVALPLR